MAELTAKAQVVVWLRQEERYHNIKQEEKEMAGEQSTEKTSTTKLISVFFPLKPLKNKFSENFISIQIADFVPKLSSHTEKAIIYKIDKERFYTYDLKNEKFDDKFDVVDNQTMVVIFSIDKSSQIDVSNLFETDFAKSINTIRIHRKRVDPIVPNKNVRPSYIFYTINSTKLLNSIIPIIQNDKSENEETAGGKTYFILSANNAKRDIDPLDKSFTTEKICRMNYVSTIVYDKIEDEENFAKLLKRKINNQIKF
jgi:hypothetical protein